MEAVDYAPALRALAVVLADGRCAMCRAADGGLAPVEQLAFTHWVCNAGSGAQCVRIGAPCCQRRPVRELGSPYPAARAAARSARASARPAASTVLCVMRVVHGRQDSSAPRCASFPPSTPAAAVHHRASVAQGLGSCAGARAQLVAVGLATGEVALYRLWAAKASDPLRVISLADWGYEPEATGSVADLQWAPDNRAIAVRPLDAFVTTVLFVWSIHSSDQGCAAVLLCLATNRHTTAGCSPAAPHMGSAWVSSAKPV